MVEVPEIIEPAWVEARLRDILAAAGDAEVAHGLEDDLRAAVLLRIAEDRAVKPRVCAALVLLTSDADFPRWCA